jgi:hypothetical protein
MHGGDSCDSYRVLDDELRVLANLLSWTSRALSRTVNMVRIHMASMSHVAQLLPFHHSPYPTRTP